MSISVHIRKRFGDFYLSVDLDHPGGICGLLGASGSGKTMTLKCIAGIEKPDEGKIVLNGRILFDSDKKINLKPQERKVGLMFQNYALFPNMTAEQNILCGMRGIKDKAEKTKKLEEMLSFMDLFDCRKLYPRQLSGGEQQRTALARILSGNPETILLDEPFSALDSFLREVMQTRTGRILREYGKDVVLVSHSRDEIYYLCDRAAVMEKGKILRYADVKQVFSDPRCVTAAILTGCKNIASARKTGERTVLVTDWGISFETEAPVKDGLTAVGIRAHYFNPDLEENRYPVIITEQREEPFENRILFRYESQKKESPDLWWRVPKGKTPAVMPKMLGVRPEDVLLLYV